MDDYKEEKRKALRSASCSVDSNDKLVDVLYTLMRDHIAVGVLEGLVQDAEKSPEEIRQYSNGWLANYAKNLSDRLK